MSRFLLVITFLSASLFTQIGFAQEVSLQETKKQTQSLIDEKKFSKAYEAIKTVPNSEIEKLSGATLLDFLFTRGLARLYAGKEAEAVKDFEKILVSNPNFDRVRLELGLAYERAGELAKAREQYQHVLAKSPPEAVELNIKKRLIGLQKQPAENVPGQNSKLRMKRDFSGDKKWDWGFNGSVGYIYDDNVNAGPSTDEILIFDLPFVLTADTLPQKDHGWQIRANADLSYKINQRWSVYGMLNYSRVDYISENDYDFDSIRLTAGGIYNRGKWQIGLPINYNISLLGNELYSQAIGVSPQFSWTISPRWYAKTYSFIGTNFNDRVDDRSGESYYISQSLRWTSKSGKYYIEPRIFYALENADVDFFKSNQFGGSIGLYASLPFGFHLFVEPSIRRSDYDGEEPLFEKSREETQFMVNANLGRSLGFWGLEGALGYTFTNNDSNIPLFDYDRNQVTFLIRKEW